MLHHPGCQALRGIVAVSAVATLLNVKCILTAAVERVTSVITAFVVVPVSYVIWTLVTVQTINPSKPEISSAPGLRLDRKAEASHVGDGFQLFRHLVEWLSSVDLRSGSSPQ